MSYVIAAPEYLAAAATDLSNIGSALSDANFAALGPVSSVLPAGADEVSASIAALFGAHAQAYEAISAAAQAFHAQFVQLMSGGAEQYVLAEAANATPLQTVGSGLLTESTAPAQAFTAAQPVAGTAASAPPRVRRHWPRRGSAGGSAPGNSPGAADDLGCTGVGSAGGARSGRHGGGGAGGASGSSALIPAGTAPAAVPVESEVPLASGAPASATTSVAAVEAEAPAFSPLRRCRPCH